MPTLQVSCFIKVDDNKTRMKWHKVLVSDIITFSKAAEIWPSMTKQHDLENIVLKLSKS